MPNISLVTTYLLIIYLILIYDIFFQYILNLKLKFICFGIKLNIQLPMIILFEI